MLHKACNTKCVIYWENNKQYYLYISRFAIKAKKWRIFLTHEVRIITIDIETMVSKVLFFFL